MLLRVFLLRFLNSALWSCSQPTFDCASPPLAPQPPYSVFFALSFPRCRASQKCSCVRPRVASPRNIGDLFHNSCLSDEMVSSSRRPRHFVCKTFLLLHSPRQIVFSKSLCTLIPAVKEAQASRSRCLPCQLLLGPPKSKPRATVRDRSGHPEMTAPGVTLRVC